MKTNRFLTTLIILGVSIAAHADPSPSASSSPSPVTATIISIEPANGPLEGDSLVHLSGLRFTEDCTVKFGNQDCTELRWLSETDGYCRTSPVVSSAKVDVSVKCDSGESTLNGGFFYFDSLRLVSPPKAVLDSQPFVLVASGGVAPYQYSDQDGNCQVDPASGAAKCGYAYEGGPETILVKDASGNQVQAQIQIVSPLVQTSTLYLPEDSENQLYANGGFGPFQFTVASGNAQITVRDNTSYLELPKGAQKVTLSLADSLGERNQFDVQVVDSGYPDPRFGLSEGMKGFVSFGQWAGKTTPILQTWNGKAMIGINEGIYQKGDSSSGVGVVRIDPDGNVDASYGNQGFAEDPVPTDDTDWIELGAMDTLENGSVLLAGSRFYSSIWTWWNDHYEIRLSRLLPNGQRDMAFGESNGETRIGIGSYSLALSLARRPDRNYWVGVAVCDKDDDAQCHPVVLLVDRNGKQIKPSGEAGKTRISLDEQNHLSYDMSSFFQVLADDGNGFFAYFLNTQGLSLLHYDASGSLDPNFTASELKNVKLAGKCSSGQIARQEDRVFVTWNCQTENQTLFLQGLMLRATDGSIDMTFGYSGYLAKDDGTYFTSNGSWATFQQDGKLLLPLETGLIRLLPNGQLDESFGNQGHAINGDSDYAIDGPVTLDGDHGVYQLLSPQYVGRFIR